MQVEAQSILHNLVQSLSEVTAQNNQRTTWTTRLESGQSTVLTLTPAIAATALPLMQPLLAVFPTSVILDTIATIIMSSYRRLSRELALLHLHQRTVTRHEACRHHRHREQQQQFRQCSTDHSTKHLQQLVRCDVPQRPASRQTRSDHVCGLLYRGGHRDS